MNRENDSIFLDFEHITNLVISIITLLKQQNKKLFKINEKIKEEVEKEMSSNYQFTFDLDTMDEIKEDIDVMIENNERPEIPESFVPPVPLTTEEIKEKTKQKDKSFIQTSLAFREKELRAANEIRMKKIRTSSKTLLIQRLVFW